MRKIIFVGILSSILGSSAFAEECSVDELYFTQDSISASLTSSPEYPRGGNILSLITQCKRMIASDKDFPLEPIRYFEVDAVDDSDSDTSEISGSSGSSRTLKSASVSAVGSPKARRFSLDNRRLYIAKKCGLSKIQCVRASSSDIVRERWKLTTGLSPETRDSPGGYPKIVEGKTLHEGVHPIFCDLLSSLKHLEPAKLCSAAPLHKKKHLSKPKAVARGTAVGAGAPAELMAGPKAHLTSEDKTTAFSKPEGITDPAAFVESGSKIKHSDFSPKARTGLTPRVGKPALFDPRTLAEDPEDLSPSAKPEGL